MIRPMTDDDVPVAGRIWLEASLIAHDFVPAEFWHADHEVMTSEILPGSCKGSNNREEATDGSADPDRFSWDRRGLHGP